ncbi:MAG TPA: cyanophycin synthetase, partial [Pyrinomonadaceae bacterium]|nr:cyanophycin synthetase [Pyrinomonadaceae bacterium]
AHNPAGFRGLTKFVSKLPNKYRTVVMTVPGDRRDDDIREMGEIAGNAFDRIVIRHGHYLRGRDPNEVTILLQEGIARTGKEPQVRVIPHGRDAIHHAVKNGRKGELVVTLADLVPQDIQYVQEIRDKLLEEQQQAESEQ